MTLKNAALLALVCTGLLTVVLGIDFINTAFAVIRGLLPDMRLLTAFVYVLASLSVTIFFYFFHRAQS